MDTRRHILVIQSLGIGDAVFALPAARALKGAYPDDRLVFVTNALNAEIVRDAPGVDAVVPYASRSALSLVRLVRTLRRRPLRAAVVLNPIWRGSVLAWLTGAPVRVGYEHDLERQQSMHGLGWPLLTHRYRPRPRAMHEIDRYLDLLALHGVSIDAVDRRPRLALSDAARARGRAILEAACPPGSGPVVLINPNAGWALKRWPTDRVAAIADWLVERYDARVAFSGARGDRADIDRLRSQMRRPAGSLAGAVSLSELAGVLAGCRLLLTNDSGPMHIAAALDVPVVALFGPSDPARVQPRSPMARVLYDRAHCSPCQVMYTDKCRDNICMQRITIDAVQTAVAAALEDRSRASG